MKVCHNSTHHPESPITYTSERCPACRLALEKAELLLSDVYAEMELDKAHELVADCRAIIESLQRLVERSQKR